jgi:hypothetical protein
MTLPTTRRTTFSLVSDLVEDFDYGCTYRWNVVAHVPGDEVWMHDYSCETGDGANPPAVMERLLARIKAANPSVVCRDHWCRVD